MRKGSEAFEWPTVFIMGMILLGIVFLIVIIQFAPVIIHGSCWGGLKGSLNGLVVEAETIGQTTGSAHKTIKPGSCVGLIAFVNKGGVDNLRITTKEFIQCKDSPASVVAIPHFDDTSFGFDFWNWPEDAWNNVKKGWSEEFRGIEPICMSLDKPINVVGGPKGSSNIQGPNQGGASSYCVTIESGLSYSISWVEGECK